MFNGYQGWIDGLRDWLDVDDYTDAKIASFLSLGQQRLNRELASYDMQATFIGTIGEDPDPHMQILDFGRIRGVSVQGVGNYYAVPKAEVIDAETKGYSERNIYAIEAGQLFLYPMPLPGAYLLIDYTTEVAPISDTLDTNTFTEKHPDALLYAACLAAAPYMAEDERIPTWASSYAQCVEAYNQVQKRVQLGSTPLRRVVKVA